LRGFAAHLKPRESERILVQPAVTVKARWPQTLQESQVFEF
jgi:hypothetical protein